MLFCFGISVYLGHPEIDDVDNVCLFRTWSANEEIVGLDVAVDVVLFVDCLYP